MAIFLTIFPPPSSPTFNKYIPAGIVYTGTWLSPAGKLPDCTSAPVVFTIVYDDADCRPDTVMTSKAGLGKMVNWVALRAGICNVVPHGLTVTVTGQSGLR